MALMRMARRRTSWEIDDHDQLIKLEFSTAEDVPDLALSVFQIASREDEAHEVTKVQAAAEYWASYMEPSPPMSRDHVDLEHLPGIEKIQTTDSETEFLFTRQAHRELIIHDEPALGSLVKTLRETVKQRLLPVTREAIKAHIASPLPGHVK